MDDDLYSTNLTQAEIQGHLKRINKEIALENVVLALKSKNTEILQVSMVEIGVKHFIPVRGHPKILIFEFLKTVQGREVTTIFQANSDAYFASVNFVDEVEVETLEKFVLSVNETVRKTNDRNAFLKKIKQSISEKNEEKLMENLQSAPCILPSLTNARPGSLSFLLNQ